MFRLENSFIHLPAQLAVNTGKGIWRTISVKVSDARNISPVTERYTITCRDMYGGHEGKLIFHVPRILDRYRTYKYRGNSYIGAWYLARPVVSVGISQRGNREIYLQPVHPELPPIILYDGGRGLSLSARHGNERYFDIDNNHWLFRSFRMRDWDREDFNSITGSTCDENYLTPTDIESLKDIYFNHPDFVTNWKYLDNMRLISIEDVAIEIIAGRLPFACRGLASGEGIRSDMIIRGIESWFAGGSQSHFLTSQTDIYKYGISQRVVLPVRAYDREEDSQPDESWKGAICSVDTPQSSKAGGIGALVEGAIIRRGKIIPHQENILSGILCKIPLVQHLDMRRVVMMSALLKQCVSLGNDGEFGEEPYIYMDGTSHIPDVSGRHALVMLSDFAWTHEDGTLISTSLAEKMTTSVDVTQTLVTTEKFPDLEIKPGDHLTYHKILATILNAPDSVGIKDVEQVTTEGKLRIFRYDSPVTGVVTGILQYQEMQDGVAMFITEIAIRREYFCSTGSKLCGLHGNKSIIGTVVHDHQMPLAYIDGTWRTVDMILSPMMIGNRMNPSAVLEGMLNMGLMIISERNNIRARLSVKSWGKENYWDMARYTLKSLGLPETCRFPIRRNQDTTRLAPHKAFVAPMFIMRLHHHSPDKLRLGNSISTDFRGVQRRGVGPQRLNREEMEILYAWNTPEIMEEVKHNMLSSDLPARADEFLRCLGVWRRK